MRNQNTQFWGGALNSLGMLRSAVLATASAWVLVPQASLAQSPAQSGAQNIPSVTVAAPEARRRAAASAQRRAPRSSEQTANRNKPQPQRNVGFVETPARPGARLRRRPQLVRHQDQHADHGDAAGGVGDRRGADPRPEAEQARRGPALYCRRPRRDIRRGYAQRLVADPRLQVRRHRSVPRRHAAVLHVLCELEAPAAEHGARRSAARPVRRALWRIEPERHRQRHQQDAAGRAGATSRPASTISATPMSASMSAVRSRRSPENGKLFYRVVGQVQKAPRRSTSRPTTTTSSRRP